MHDRSMVMSKNHPSGLSLIHSLHRRLLSLQLQLRAREQRALVLGPLSNFDILLQIVIINNCTFCIINVPIFNSFRLSFSGLISGQ